MSTVVALDIGSSAIAGVELKTARERVTLAKAAVEPLPPGLVHDGEIVRPDELAGEIRRFWRATRFAGKRVRLGVANQRVVVRTIELPALDDERERRAAVEFEAAEQIPIPPDQTVVDSQPVLRFANDAGERERHVVVAAHRDMVEGLTSTVRQAGLVPVGIDLEAFAILRALLPPPSVIDEGSEDTSAVAICHVGAEVTNMIVSVDRRCHFTRLVGFGGNHLTAAVSDRTGLPADEAEAVKTACGLLGRAAGRLGRRHRRGGAPRARARIAAPGARDHALPGVLPVAELRPADRQAGHLGRHLAVRRDRPLPAAGARDPGGDRRSPPPDRRQRRPEPPTWRPAPPWPSAWRSTRRSGHEGGQPPPPDPAAPARVHRVAQAAGRRRRRGRVRPSWPSGATRCTRRWTRPSPTSPRRRSARRAAPAAGRLPAAPDQAGRAGGPSRRRRPGWWRAGPTGSASCATCRPSCPIRCG